MAWNSITVSNMALKTMRLTELRKISLNACNYVFYDLVQNRIKYVCIKMMGFMNVPWVQHIVPIALQCMWLMQHCSLQYRRIPRNIVSVPRRIFPSLLPLQQNHAAFCSRVATQTATAEFGMKFHLAAWFRDKFQSSAVSRLYSHFSCMKTGLEKFYEIPSMFHDSHIIGECSWDKKWALNMIIFLLHFLTNIFPPLVQYWLGPWLPDEPPVISRPGCWRWLMGLLTHNLFRYIIVRMPLMLSTTRAGKHFRF